MTAKENFISEIEKLLEINTINEDAMNYFNDFKNGVVKNSSIITEKGAMILQFLQTQGIDYTFTSKSLSEMIDMSSRSISGTLKKLVTDNLIEKLSATSPITYKITEQGFAFNIEANLDKIKN